VHGLVAHGQCVGGNRVQPDGITQFRKFHPHFAKLSSDVSPVKRQRASGFLQRLYPRRMVFGPSVSNYLGTSLWFNH
jgi:hypothetical protein